MSSRLEVIDSGISLPSEVEGGGGRFRDIRRARAAYCRAYGLPYPSAAAAAGVRVDELKMWELSGDEEYLYWFLRGIAQLWVESGIKAVRTLVELMDSDIDRVRLDAASRLLQSLGSVAPRLLGGNLVRVERLEVDEFAAALREVVGDEG